MWSQRVEAHAGFMFTSYEITRTFVVDRQQRLLGEASQHRLARYRRQARRWVPTIDDGRPGSRVLHLPASAPQSGQVEDRVAS